MKTKVSLLLACAILRFTVASTRADWVVWSPAQGGNGHSYLAVRAESLVSWSDAFAQAQALGGHLVTITSAEENAFVFGLINQPQFWNGELGPLIGGFQPPGSGEPLADWQWVSGEPFEFSNWAGGQPDNGAGGEEDCIHFWVGDQWNDRTKDDKDFFGFVVEQEKCTPHRATAVARVSNGFVSGATVTDSGCGYTNTPAVLIQGGGGFGATAAAVVVDGQVTEIRVVSTGCCYTNAPRIVIASPGFVPTVGISVSKVKVTQHVGLGRRYVLESSHNLLDWTATGPPFTAESETLTNEFDVSLTGRFFRLREVP